MLGSENTASPTSSNFIPTNNEQRGPSPKVVKQMTKELNKETKQEEKYVKGAVKDLSNTQKAEEKAQKEANKADKVFGKLQKLEQDTLKDLYKYQEKHDIALAKLNKAQQDRDLSKRNHEMLHEAVQSKNANMEGIIDQQKEHEQVRNEKRKSLLLPSTSQEI